MDYKKKYEEALERAKDIYNDDPNSSTARAVCEQIFPELKESEDENVLKDIISYFKNDGTYYRPNSIVAKKWIAWLEKQKTTEEALQYLKENHSPSEMSDFQAAMNISVAKAYNKGYADGFEKQGGITKLSEEEQNRFAKGVLSSCALSFINYLDAHAYEGKMCVSNGECEDIENAFHNAMWDRLHRYYCKYIENQGEQKPTDKAEPKFKVGDYIVNEHGFIMQIDGIDGNMYIYHVLDDNSKILTYYITKTDKSCHLWTIQDAKDGDVLVDNYGNVVIYQELSTNLMYHSYCYGNKTHFIDTGGSHFISKTYPATKKQCDLLFQKMKEAGYKWDAEKKELKKIDARENLILDGDLMQADCMIIEQKPAWSEEDEDYLSYVNTAVNDYFDEGYAEELWGWLKSIKERLKGE